MKENGLGVDGYAYECLISCRLGAGVGAGTRCLPRGADLGLFCARAEAAAAPAPRGARRAAAAGGEGAELGISSHKSNICLPFPSRAAGKEPSGSLS